MKIAVMTSLLAEWYVNVNAAHFLVCGPSYSVPVFSLAMKTATEN
jgi:hypothetical protein